MSIDALTIGQFKELSSLISSQNHVSGKALPPVEIGDIVRIESVTYAHEGVVFAVTPEYITLSPAMRNTDMVRLHRHLAGEVNDAHTENELCPKGVKIACQAITCILPMVEPSTGWKTNKV